MKSWMIRKVGKMDDFCEALLKSILYENWISWYECVAKDLGYGFRPKNAIKNIVEVLKNNKKEIKEFVKKWKNEHFLVNFTKLVKFFGAVSNGSSD